MIPCLNACYIGKNVGFHTMDKKHKAKEGACAYCGKWGVIPSDHVPTACLFSKPRPSDLVTVPCCSSCNREFMKDDEYFRIAVTTGIDKVKFPRENADSVRAINKLVRPQSFGFARRVLQGFRRNRVSSSSRILQKSAAP